MKFALFTSLFFSFIAQAETTMSTAEAFALVTPAAARKTICEHFVEMAQDHGPDRAELIQKTCLVQLNFHFMNLNRPQPDPVVEMYPDLVYSGQIRVAVRPTPDSQILHCTAETFVSRLTEVVESVETTCR